MGPYPEQAVVGKLDTGVGLVVLVWALGEQVALVEPVVLLETDYMFEEDVLLN